MAWGRHECNTFMIRWIFMFSTPFLIESGYGSKNFICVGNPIWNLYLLITWKSKHRTIFPDKCYLLNLLKSCPLYVADMIIHLSSRLVYYFINNTLMLIDARKIVSLDDEIELEVRPLCCFNYILLERCASLIHIELCWWWHWALGWMGVYVVVWCGFEIFIVVNVFRQAENKGDSMCRKF